MTNRVVNTTNGFFKTKGKVQVPADLDSDPSLSESSSRKSDLSDGRNYIKSKRKKGDAKKKRRKQKKQDPLDSSLSDSDSSGKMTINVRESIRRRSIRKITLSTYAQG